MSSIYTLPPNGIIAILRRVPVGKLPFIAQALWDGGIQALECTFDQADPLCEKILADSLDLLSKEFSDVMAIGAGTVLTENQVQIAYDHGARLIVSPGTDEAVIQKTRALGMLSLPGAMTPTEALRAHRAGADYVKLFPAGDLGVGYLKSLVTPLAHIHFLAVGGITKDNIAAFADAGAKGFGISSVLTPKDAIEQNDFAQIQKRAAELICALNP